MRALAQLSKFGSAITRHWRRAPCCASITASIASGVTFTSSCTSKRMAALRFSNDFQRFSPNPCAARNSFSSTTARAGSSDNDATSSRSSASRSSCDTILLRAVTMRSNCRSRKSSSRIDAPARSASSGRNSSHVTALPSHNAGGRITTGVAASADAGLSTVALVPEAVATAALEATPVLEAVAVSFVTGETLAHAHRELAHATHDRN